MPDLSIKSGLSVKGEDADQYTNGSDRGWEEIRRYFCGRWFRNIVHLVMHGGCNILHLDMFVPLLRRVWEEIFRNQCASRQVIKLCLCAVLRCFYGSGTLLMGILIISIRFASSK